MSIIVTSTTDSQEVLNAVNGVKDSTKPVEEKKSVSTEELDETEENSEALENESDEVEGDNAEESEDDQEDKEDIKDEEHKPKKKGFKNRIQKLRGKLSAKEQELNYWKEQALKGNAQPKESQSQEAPKETKQAGKPNPNDFDSHEEYVEAVADWKIEQREAARMAKERETQVKTEYQRALDAHNARVAEFQKKQSDYEEVISSFLEDNGDVKFSPALEESILTSDFGPALLYELAKNPEELMRINSLGYGAAQRAIGKIEARLENSSESSKNETKKQTKAPPPVKPVGSSKAPVKKSIHDPNISFAEYERLRNEQLKNS